MIDSGGFSQFWRIRCVRTRMLLIRVGIWENRITLNHTFWERMHHYFLRVLLNLTASFILFLIWVIDTMKRLNSPAKFRSTRKKLPKLTLACLLAVSFAFLPAELFGQIEVLDSKISDAFKVTRGQLIDLELDTTPGQVVREAVTIDGEDYSFELFPYSVRSPKYILREQVGPGQYETREPEASRTLRGSMVGSKGSRVFGSMLETGLSAKIVMGDGEIMFIEPLASRMDEIKAGEPQASMHLVYKATDTVPHEGNCKTQDGALHHFENVRRANQRRDALFQNQPPAGPQEGTSSEDMIAELALDADFEYFTDYGSINATNARMELIINIVNNQYEDEVDISHLISGVVIRSTSNDPYTSSDAGTLLTQFRNEWLANQTAIQRDVAHLFTGRTINGGTIGIANTIGGICTTFAFCLSESDFNGALVCATDLTAHELGHLWNGSHCNCPSRTMNPSITCANTFDPNQTVPDIIAHRNSRTCLDASDAVPENDDWENSSPMGSLPATVSGSTINGTTQIDEQQLTETGSTVWWFFTAQDTGIATVDTFGSNFDTQLHIFTGSENGFANLVPVATNDDAEGTSQSTISFAVNSGQRYEVRVGGFTNGGDPADGLAMVNATFVAEGPTDFFWSNRAFDSGADNTSNADGNFMVGSTGSVYLYYDPLMSDIDTGAFFDIATSQPGVIEFTGAETFDFDITAAGSPFSVRWGDAFGMTGVVSPDFIDELGAFNVVSGEGMLVENTGPTFVDQGFDFAANGFLFARIDFNVIGPAGSTVDIVTSAGNTGIVNSGNALSPGIGAMTINVMDALPPTTDFFLSVADLDDGAINDSTPINMFSEGESGSLFLYYDAMMSDLDTGAFLDIETSTTGVIEFTNATTFDFDIDVNGTPFSTRWGDAFGETGTVSPNFIEGLGAFTIVSGTGILAENTGPVFFDQGYDPSAEAFLFGRVDFEVVGSAGDSVDIIVDEGVAGIVHQGMIVDASFGMATVMVSDFLLGDVNCDGAVTLLDVEPFVELLSTGGFSAKADFNMDGVITLLDIQGFVDALNGM